MSGENFVSNDFINEALKNDVGSKYRGVGTFITKSKTRRDQAHAPEPMGRIQSDSALMKQTEEELRRKRTEILESIYSTSNKDFAPNQAGNLTATQVRAIIDSRRDFLNRVKDNMQKAYNLTANIMISFHKSSVYKEYVKKSD